MNYGFVCPGGARPFDFAARQAFVDIAANKAASVAAEYKHVLQERGGLTRRVREMRDRCVDKLRASGANRDELVFLDLLWQDIFDARFKARTGP